MPYYRTSRVGCGSVLARGVLMVMVGIIALICIANRSWFETKALNSIYGHRPEIHLGRQFSPGATAVEDGVRQTAVLIGGVPYVRVTAPTREWRRHHQDAACAQGICTAPATAKRFAGSGGAGPGTVLAGLLACFVGWTLLMGDSDRFPWRS